MSWNLSAKMMSSAAYMRGTRTRRLWCPTESKSALPPSVESRLCTPSSHDVQQLNQEIIDCATEGIVVCDRELRYQVWNPSWSS